MRRVAALVAGAGGTCLLLAVLRHHVQHVRRRKRRAHRLAETGAAVQPPAHLVGALRSYDVVAVLGAGAFAPLAHSGLAGLLADALPGTQGALGTDVSSNGEQCEMAVGDLGARLGRERVARSCRGSILRRQRQLGEKVAAAIHRRLVAISSLPFTAVLTEAWVDALEEYFPHRVGRNFGGFSAALMKPRVDAAPGRSRPLLQLWPGLGAPADGNLPPASRAECQKQLESAAPYPAFLRDLFRSKTVVLVGWQLPPPAGHFATALRQAWRDEQTTRKAAGGGAGPQDWPPMAYAVSCCDAVDEFVRAQCFEDFGLEVMGEIGVSPDVYESDDDIEDNLERRLGALAVACYADASL